MRKVAWRRCGAKDSRALPACRKASLPPLKSGSTRRLSRAATDGQDEKARLSKRKPLGPGCDGIKIKTALRERNALHHLTLVTLVTEWVACKLTFVKR